jgi:hypothetical protein
VPAQLAEQLFKVESEICWRWLIAASVTGPLFWRSARSIIAVTAKRPLVVRRMASSLCLAIPSVPRRLCLPKSVCAHRSGISPILDNLASPATSLDEAYELLDFLDYFRQVYQKAY